MYDTPPADELVWPAAAAHMASLISKTDCDRALFMSLAVRHCLPIFATSSEIVAPLCNRSVDGTRYKFPVYEKRANNVLLLPHELFQLENGDGPVYASQVVAGYDDPLCVDWAIVKRHRDSEYRVDHVYPAFNQGRWMGQSVDMYLAAPVQIRDADNLQVPRHTIDEVARLLRSEVRKLPASDAIGDAGDTEDAPVGAARSHASEVPVRGITKHQVIEVFQPMVRFNLEKALGNGKGLYGPNGARVQKGSMGRNQRHVGLWNPIILAVAFYERDGVPLPKLKQAFRTHDCLLAWAVEFTECAENLL